MAKHEEKLKELKHEAWPGYRKVFVVVFPLFTFYLALMFMMMGMMTVGGGHH